MLRDVALIVNADYDYMFPPAPRSHTLALSCARDAR